MIHEYYQYSREQLLERPKIPLEVGADNEAVFRAMADEMVEGIQSRAALGRTCVFICPVGPVGQYPFFVERVNRENISLKHCWFINMDEYLDGEKKWVPMSHPLSFRGFMEREVYSQIRPELNVPEGQRVFPDPDNLAYIPELIEKLGGVDVCFGGIGDFGGALEDMPSYCVTIGFHEIYHARKIRLGVFRNWHRGVVRRAAYGAPSAEFPVSLLQGREDVLIRMTGMVAE